MEQHNPSKKGCGVEADTIINFVWRTENGEAWHKPEVYQDETVRKNLFAPPCVSYCGWPLRRWHLTCISPCEIRRAPDHQPPKRKVTVHIQYIPVELPVWRRKLVKWLDSVAEALMQP